MHRTLDMLCPGVSAQVRELYPQSDPNRLKRLWDLGFTGGARVKCLFRAPSG